MRVDATLSAPAPSTATAASPAQGDVALSFQQLLDEGVAPEVQRQERAFGFSELGVIRLNQTTTTPQALATAEHTPACAPDDAETLARTAAAVSEAAAVRTGASLPETRSGALAERSFQEMSAVRPQAIPELRQTIVASQPRPTFRPARQNQVSPPKAQNRPLPQNGQSKRFSLVVSEQDGAVQIIAGAPQLSAEAKGRLRKAAAMLAAEFGVTLGGFTINGALVDAPAPTTGALDGDFPG